MGPGLHVFTFHELPSTHGYGVMFSSIEQPSAKITLLLGIISVFVNTLL